jgi:hypothetical protein
MIQPVMVSMGSILHGYQDRGSDASTLFAIEVFLEILQIEKHVIVALLF